MLPFQNYTERNGSTNEMTPRIPSLLVANLIDEKRNYWNPKIK